VLHRLASLCSAETARLVLDHFLVAGASVAVVGDDDVHQEEDEEGECSETLGEKERSIFCLFSIFYPLLFIIIDFCLFY
jgi:hypothetical protein